MTTHSANVVIPAVVQQAYRDNFARHILRITLYVQSQIMHALTVKHGHSQLRINFEPYIGMANQAGGARLSDIATRLGISRQGANLAVNQIEAAGYIQRKADPADGRAKRIVATPRAKALIKLGAKEAQKLQTRFEQIVGKRVLAEMTVSLTALNRQCTPVFPYADVNAGDALPLAAVLLRLSDYITDRLQQLTMAMGHPNLKRSYGQVLTAIGPDGGRMQQMASTHDVSKQAISAIALELEHIGYIRRHPDPQDARQVVLKFTERGKRLLSDSVASVDQLAVEFKQQLGAVRFAQLQLALAQIYRSQHLEDDVFGHGVGGNTQTLARQLYRELGEENAKALGHLLISGNSSF